MIGAWVQFIGPKDPELAPGTVGQVVMRTYAIARPGGQTSKRWGVVWYLDDGRRFRGDRFEDDLCRIKPQRVRAAA